MDKGKTIVKKEIVSVPDDLSVYGDERDWCDRSGLKYEE